MFNYKTDLSYERLNYTLVEGIKKSDVKKWLDGDTSVFEGVVVISGICPICDTYMEVGVSFCSMCTNNLENDAHYDTKERNQEKLKEYEELCDLVLFYTKDYVNKNQILMPATILKEDYLSFAKWQGGSVW